MPGDRVRLLALDGGGIRGLSTLMILQQLMITIDPESPPKPCEYFDMIGGTSTGGLIAIMLGRLQMTVDDCIDAYTSLSDQKMLTTRTSWQIRLDQEQLERVLRAVWVTLYA
ncbi:acyl transferase/acyl hydrolase/lysophospholipase [Xylariaceae sp. AK1471]|nr:acyl transferase/acyl hydrolase/lysophospholipase [Xylariaceae sp. AK1471]